VVAKVRAWRSRNPQPSTTFATGGHGPPNAAGDPIEQASAEVARRADQVGLAVCAVEVDREADLCARYKVAVGLGVRLIGGD